MVAKRKLHHMQKNTLHSKPLSIPKGLSNVLSRVYGVGVQVEASMLLDESSRLVVRRLREPQGKTP